MLVITTVLSEEKKWIKIKEGIHAKSEKPICIWHTGEIA